MGKLKIKVIARVHVKPLRNEEDEEVREAQLVGLLDKEVFLTQEVESESYS